MSEHKSGIRVYHNSNKPVEPVEIKEEYKITIDKPKPPPPAKTVNIFVVILIIYGILFLLSLLSQVQYIPDEPDPFDCQPGFPCCPNGRC